MTQVSHLRRDQLEEKEEEYQDRRRLVRQIMSTRPGEMHPEGRLMKQKHPGRDSNSKELGAYGLEVGKNGIGTTQSRLTTCK